MDILNDSGYGSPPTKRQRTDENTENTVQWVHFYFKPKTPKGLNSQQQHDELVGAEKKTLATVFVKKYPKMRVEKYIFRARIRGRGGLFCAVNPFLLPCGLIEPNTEVETDECDDIYDNVSQEQVQMTKPYSKPQVDVVGFFISNSTEDRKKKRGITRVNYKALHCEMIFVAGLRGQTLREALVQDGRFSNVDCFVVNRKIQGGQGPKVGFDEKIENFKEETLQIKARKLSASTDGKYLKQNSQQTTSSQSSGVSRTDSVVPETSAKKTRNISKSALVKKQLEEDAMFVFSKEVNDLSTIEMLSEMRECLEARAWSSLLGPAERSRKEFKKSIAKLAKVQFANQNIVARPVSFSKIICKLYDSVGHIRCGTVVATCFLVSDDMIITNYHVVEAITKARRSSIHGNHGDIFVYFDYEEPGGVNTSHGYRLLRLLSEGNIHCQKLDYSFLRLEEKVERKALGEYVSCVVPEIGKLCIVGHPSGDEKQDELCPIIPLHDDRYTRRMGSTNQDKAFVYMYNPSIRELKDDKSFIPYHVGSMFHGSSGAPVFDMKGQIVALHMGGFNLEETNILEFGMTFDAIITDLKSKKDPQFVRKHFPNCYDEVMEQD